MRNGLTEMIIFKKNSKHNNPIKKGASFSLDCWYPFVSLVVNNK